MASSTSSSGADVPPVLPSIPLSPEPVTAPADQSIGGLVREATAQMSTLVRAEVELAKTEVTAEVRKGVQGSVFFIVALTILLFSLFFLFFTLAELLALWLNRPAVVRHRVRDHGAVRRAVRRSSATRGCARSASRNGRSPRSRSRRRCCRRSAGASDNGAAHAPELSSTLTGVRPPFGPDPSSVAAARSVDPSRGQRQRDPPARRRVRRRPAGAVAARLPAVLVGVAAPAPGPGRAAVTGRWPSTCAATGTRTSHPAATTCGPSPATSPG